MAWSTRRGCSEESTDNVDPQSIIRYDVYANGVFDHSRRATAPSRTAIPAPTLQVSPGFVEASGGSSHARLIREEASVD
jgi:hypothetical protein